MELVTLQTFSNPIDAHMLKSKLESEDIQCFLADENMVTLNPLSNIGIGGIKLKIRREDAERALAIVNENKNSPVTDENDNIIICPKCGSERIMTGIYSFKGLKGIISLVISMFFMIFPFYAKRVYQCTDCKKTFSLKKTP